MNRKQRRAEQTSNIKTANDIPLSRPPTSDSIQPKAKTLLEIAAERQSKLQPNSRPFNISNSPNNKNIVTVKVGPDGTLIPTSTDSSPDNLRSIRTEPEDQVNPWLDTLLLSFSLSTIHFTLSVLTMHQYAQSLLFPPLIKTTLTTAFPTLTFLIHLFHGHLFPSSLRRSLSATTKTWIIALRQLTYLVTANVAGCYLIQLTNDRGYYAVMKNAPGIGTIWVWTVLEMGIVGALLGVVGPAVWAWWMGYGIF